MAIVQTEETVKERTLYFTWSDSGYKIQNSDGVIYDTAWDNVQKEYTETGEPIESEDDISAEEILAILEGNRE